MRSQLVPPRGLHHCPFRGPMARHISRWQRCAGNGPARSHWQRCVVNGPARSHWQRCAVNGPRDTDSGTESRESCAFNGWLGREENCVMHYAQHDLHWAWGFGSFFKGLSSVVPAQGLSRLRSEAGTVESRQRTGEEHAVLRSEAASELCSSCKWTKNNTKEN